MALLTTQDISSGTLADFTTAAAAGGGDTVAVGSGAGGWTMATYLLVLNAGGGAITVTVTLPSGSVIGPINVAATTGRTMIRLLGVSPGGIASIAYSGVTSVTVAAIREWQGQ